MIEIVKEPRPIEEEPDYAPKNVKQIGTLQGDTVVYIEDYVYRFLHSDTRKKERQVFVFLGEIRSHKEKKKIFIRGALELEDISYGGFMPVFSDDMWDKIYCLTREYFPDQVIVGWAMQSMGTKKKEEQDLDKISRRHFPEGHGNVLLFDAYGDWETMYLAQKDGMQALPGFLVYYEKNTAMSNYLSAYHAKQEQESEEEKQKYPERFCVHDEMKYKEEVRQDVEAMARYRAYVNGQGRGGRSRVAISIALVAAMLLTGVLIQNYAKLSDMQQTVETLSKQKEKQEKEEAKTDIVQETISRAATELAQVDNGAGAGAVAAPGPAADDVVSDALPSAAVDAADTTNPYLQQGFYIVEQGDKLTDISKKIYGTEDMIAEICQYNNITDMDHICTGDKLLLP